ncbi:ribosome maturation factor RimM [Priestia koreensis]|uniref:Ribosome maturation factor RimM n=1 Tax=Priestia koreensis TaxID=284581 RepID=A0A0M0L6C7_9BACI|nr:ribosome maturation factor RimM [Priestia koreensis]KOO46630.1 16S rRNA processing protein RimM [Priestia koreensis]
MENWFNVGKIVNTHGIRGEVRVISKTDFADERYEVGNKLYIFKPNSTEPIEVTISSHREHKTFNLLTFEGYHNVNQVEQFKDSLVKVPESALGELEEGEFYFHEIIDCEVYTMAGEKIGKIKEVLTPGANDVWVVQRPKGKDALIPYIESIVKEVDIANKTVKIDVMEGLLD